jgi:hypothetical protein
MAKRRKNGHISIRPPPSIAPSETVIICYGPMLDDLRISRNTKLTCSLGTRIHRWTVRALYSAIALLGIGHGELSTLLTVCIAEMVERVMARVVR